MEGSAQGTGRRRRRPGKVAPSGHVRAALIEAARHRFAQAGYAAATLDSVAAEAGLTRGAARGHFRDKRTLFADVLAEGLQHQATMLEGLFESFGDDPRAMRGQLMAFLPALGLNNDLPLLFAELLVEARRAPQLAARLAELVARHEAMIADLVRRVVAATGRRPGLDAALLPGTFMAYAAGQALARTIDTGHPCATTGELVIALLGLDPAGR